MNRNEGIIGALLRAPLLRRAWPRRCIAAGLIGICAILALFPQPYRAAMTLTPSDPPTLSPGSIGGGLSSLTGVFGNQSEVEVLVRVAQSTYVEQQVSQRLNLPQRLGKTEAQVEVWLTRKVHIRALRGGMVMFETTLHDAKLARDIIAAFGEAARNQMATSARSETALKRDTLLSLLHDATDKLSAAQSAYDAFRLKTHYSSPQMAISAEGDRIPELERMIHEKQVELQAKREFGTDSNMGVRQVLSEIDALNSQLAQVRSTSPEEQNSVGRVVKESTEADRLRRQLDLARTVYENYLRFLQSTTAEDLAATSNARVLEPAFVDPERQFNLLPIFVALLIAIAALAMEFYRMRPPVGYEDLESRRATP